MKLALRATASDSGSWWDHLIAAIIRWRICSRWCHAGIAIGDMLLQSNPKHGLHATLDWEPSKWTLIDTGIEDDHMAALALFAERKGARYDWLGVLGFALPWLRAGSRRLYCFAWCALAIGASDARWQTPERLLAHIVTHRV
jgi:hypothetical protein